MNSKQLISILVIAVLLLLGFYYMRNQKVGEPMFDEGGALTKSIVKEPGIVVEEFNADLIMDKTVPVTFSSWGSQNDKLARTVSYVSLRTTRDLYDSHLKYLEDNGYTVTYQDFSNEAYIYSEKGEERLNYTSISAPENVTVFITEIK